MSRGPRGSGLVVANRNGASLAAMCFSWRKDESGHEKSFVEDVKATQTDNAITFAQHVERSAAWMDGPFPTTAKLVWDNNEECVSQCVGTADSFAGAMPPVNGDGCDTIEVPLGTGSALCGVAHTSSGPLQDVTLFYSDGVQSPQDVLLKEDAEKRELHFQSHGVSLRLCERVLALLSPGMEPLASALALLQTISTFVMLNTEALPHDSLQKLVRCLALLN